MNAGLWSLTGDQRSLRADRRASSISNQIKKRVDAGSENRGRAKVVYTQPSGPQQLAAVEVFALASTLRGDENSLTRKPASLSQHWQARHGRFDGRRVGQVFHQLVDDLLQVGRG